MLADFLKEALELLVDGAIDIVSAEEAPKTIRILAKGVLAIFYLGVIVFLVWSGVEGGNLIYILLAILMLLAALVFLLYQRVRRLKSAAEKRER